MAAASTSGPTDAPSSCAALVATPPESPDSTVRQEVIHVCPPQETTLSPRRLAGLLFSGGKQ